MLGRIIGAVLVLLVAAALGVLAWPQFLGLEQAHGIAQVVAMRGLIAVAAFVAAVVLTIFALLARPLRAVLAGLAAVTIAFSAANVWVVASRGIFGAEIPEPGADTVTVLAWNTLGETPPLDDVVDLVVENRADVVSLPETTADHAAEMVAALRQRGLPMQQFTFAYDTILKANSTTLLVSEALGPYRADTSSPTTTNRPSLVATPADGIGPTLAAVHTTAPGLRDPVDWRTDLEWTAALCSEPDLIVAGDLNSTIDHWAALADPEVPGARIGGCAVSAEAMGAAGIGTWPTALPALVGAPIDHVLTGSAWRTTGFRVLTSEDGSGSDHRPVLAQLVPAGTARG